MTVPLITAYPTCFFFFFSEEINYLWTEISITQHEISGLWIDVTHWDYVQCSMILCCQWRFIVFLQAFTVESKTKWSPQKKTHSQEVAMCLTANSVFELFDPLKGKVSLFFSFLFFLFSLRWNNLLPEHELDLLQVHETNSLESQNQNGSDNTKVTGSVPVWGKMLYVNQASGPPCREVSNTWRN